MAVPDESSKHGVKLVVEDYPYAADGLELWTAIKGWNAEYVDLWYKDDSAIQNDTELQTWFKEMREEGHADKKDAPGWPVLDSKKALVEILTTIQWIPSCQHAAVNFGQYDYAGWMPHHPTIVRRLIPEEGSADWDKMMKNPEKWYLETIANKDSTTTAMSVYEVLSAHSPKEEYIGERPADWTNNVEVRAREHPPQSLSCWLQYRNGDQFVCFATCIMLSNRAIFWCDILGVGRVQAILCQDC